MCELFGVNSKNNIEINDYLEKFYQHCNMHPHGWGLAIINNNDVTIDKQPIKALDSEYLLNILKQPIITKQAFAHIRLATMGYMQSCNCHPFTKKDNANRTWTLMHNGTIFKYDTLDKYTANQTGDTDSERILMYIVDKVNHVQESRQINDEELFILINSLIVELAKGNKLNLIFSNGEIMFIHSNTHHALHYLKTEDTIYFSTEPLDDSNWIEVPLNTVIAVKDGEVVYESKPHDYEYKLTKEQFDFIIKNINPSLRKHIIYNFSQVHKEEFEEIFNK